jgi:hypothetical protein
MSLGAADTSVCATSGVTEQVWLTSISPAAQFAGVTSGVWSLSAGDLPQQFDRAPIPQPLQVS